LGIQAALAGVSVSESRRGHGAISPVPAALWRHPGLDAAPAIPSPRRGGRAGEPARMSDRVTSLSDRVTSLVIESRDRVTRSSHELSITRGAGSAPRARLPDTPSRISRRHRLSRRVARLQSAHHPRRLRRTAPPPPSQTASDCTTTTHADCVGLHHHHPRRLRRTAPPPPSQTASDCATTTLADCVGLHHHHPRRLRRTYQPATPLASDLARANSGERPDRVRDRDATW
jgi:hypothetical protein